MGIYSMLIAVFWYLSCTIHDAVCQIMNSIWLSISANYPNWTLAHYFASFEFPKRAYTNCWLLALIFAECTYIFSTALTDCQSAGQMERQAAVRLAEWRWDFFDRRSKKRPREENKIYTERQKLYKKVSVIMIV